MSLVKRIVGSFKPVSQSTLVKKITDRLVGISYEELTTAERQICDLLIINGELTINEKEDWHPVERVK